ncbi:MAG: bifunctional tetrahydrofolate synthase/dihydrofolate synthase [Motiliproteus sp.]|nr:bifunctional tetrahydrofolate synthase/dihydrofolate synthase [Motiliproteus sp.]
MPSKSLDQWLAYLEACHPDEIDLGLERTQKVAQALNLTQLSCPVITVAGTNGKGSTIAYMASILMADGYRVGCFTSPHFLRYNERVCLNGVAVEDDLLCNAFEVIEQQREQLKLPLTYFEFGTLAALQIFETQPLDVVLLEVGLGGRLDAVNIVDADIGIVTTVALDHESWLGNDGEQIGFEKAGIYRGGRPAIFGEADMPMSVERHAKAIGAQLLRWGSDFSASSEQPNEWQWQGLNNYGETIQIDKLRQPQLPFENAQTAIQALQLLELEISDHAVRQGVSEARLTGRCQQLRYKQRDIILDVAHNPHAATHLCHRLQQSDVPVHCVLGMLEDKDIANTLVSLQSCVNQWYPVTLKVARGQSATYLSEQLSSLEIESDKLIPADTVKQALEQALANSNEGDRILVAGSFYTVADALAYLGDEEQ